MMGTSGTSNKLARSYVWYLGHQWMKWLTTHSASVWIRNLGTNMTSLLSYLYLYFRNLYEVSHRTTKASKFCRTIYTLDILIHSLFAFSLLLFKGRFVIDCLLAGKDLEPFLLEASARRNDSESILFRSVVLDPWLWLAMYWGFPNTESNIIALSVGELILEPL